MITDEEIVAYYRHRAEEYAARFGKKPTKTELNQHMVLAKVILSTVRSIRFLAKRGFEKDVI